MRRLPLELAGERYFERGEGYHHGGHVRSTVEHEGTIAAKVLGTHECRVRLWIEDDGLDYSCDCSLGVDGAFCIDEYLELLRAEYKRKRNFMKLLDGIG